MATGSIGDMMEYLNSQLIYKIFCLQAEPLFSRCIGKLTYSRLPSIVDIEIIHLNRTLAYLLFPAENSRNNSTIDLATRKMQPVLRVHSYRHMYNDIHNKYARNSTRE